MEPAIFSWLLSRGIRLDDRVPDERELIHLAMLRDARREANRGGSRFARLASRLGFEPARTAPEPVACACAA
jgi:hypothetical protein